METVDEEIFELEGDDLYNDPNHSFVNNTPIQYDVYKMYKTEQLAFISIIFLVIVIGNSILLCALCKSKRHNSSKMDFFIMHLCIADLLVAGISVSTDLIWKITMDWRGGNFACKMVRYLQSVVVCASTNVLVSLSIDRLNAIIRPMGFYSRGLVAKSLVVSAWVGALVVSVPLFVLNDLRVDQDNVTHQCALVFSHRWQWQVYLTCVAVVVFIAPTLIIICCYIIIMAVIWQSAQRLIPSGQAETSSDTGSRSTTQVSRSSSRGFLPQAKVKTVKVTLVIVIAFIICWSPYFVFDLLDVYGYIPLTQRKISITIFVQSLAHLNSAINPIIYGVFSSNVCARLGRTFTLKSCMDRTFFNMRGNQMPRRQISQSSVSRSVCITSVASRFEAPSTCKVNNTEESELKSALVTLHTDAASQREGNTSMEPDLLLNIAAEREECVNKDT